MANIVDISYFVGDIEVPNSNQPEIETDLNDSITKYEKEVLISLLGYTLYTELRSHVIVAGDKFDKLINGEEFTFTVGGQTIADKWEGLKPVIAYYVYFMHRKKRVSYNAGVGQEVEPKTDNSVSVSLYTKLVEVWNKFSMMYEGGYGYWDAEMYSYLPAYLNHWDEVPSAYNYLVAKKVDFPTWRYTGQGGKINRFGI